MRNRAHEVAEDLETIVDEVRHPKLPAEEHPTTRDARRGEKRMSLKPLQQYRLSRFVTPRYEPHLLSEPLLDELRDRLQRPVDRRRLGIAVVILAHTVDDDPSDIDAEYFRLARPHQARAGCVSLIVPSTVEQSLLSPAAE